MQSMKKLLSLIILTTALAMASRTGVSQPAASDAIPEIKSLEFSLSDLIVHEKWDEYEKHLAPDFMLVPSNGKLLARKDVMAEFRSGPRKIIVMEPEDLRVRVYGETAILQGQLTTSGREAGRVTTHVERFTNVFVKQDGQWCLTSEQETTIGK